MTLLLSHNLAFSQAINMTLYIEGGVVLMTDTATYITVYNVEPWPWCYTVTMVMFDLAIGQLLQIQCPEFLYSRRPTY